MAGWRWNRERHLTCVDLADLAGTNLSWHHFFDGLWHTRAHESAWGVVWPGLLAHLVHMDVWSSRWELDICMHSGKADQKVKALRQVILSWNKGPTHFSPTWGCSGGWPLVFAAARGCTPPVIGLVKDCNTLAGMACAHPCAWAPVCLLGPHAPLCVSTTLIAWPVCPSMHGHRTQDASAGEKVLCSSPCLSLGTLSEPKSLCRFSSRCTALSATYSDAHLLGR